MGALMLEQCYKLEVRTWREDPDAPLLRSLYSFLIFLLFTELRLELKCYNLKLITLHVMDLKKRIHLLF